MTSAALTHASATGVAIDVERDHDLFARENLLDAAMGASRFRKTSERLRAGRIPALALVARDDLGRLVGTVRLWHVDAGGWPALLLGPLAVAADRRCDGIGARLMGAAIARAKAAGHGAVLLVGDAPYYARFGFSRDAAKNLQMPGPVELDRFLGLELREGALARARGRLRPTGERAQGRSHAAPGSRRMRKAA